MVFAAAALVLQPRAAPPAAMPVGGTPKPVSFAILEDYPKGTDLSVISADFALMRELEIDTLRFSIGWDDYEPTPGGYDWDWLGQFVGLAREHGLTLRPYIGYTPEWAGAPGSDDGISWNNPPADPAAWSAFVGALVTVLRPYGNVRSYEIYNEQNDRLWWDGTPAEYAATLRTAAAAIRRADPAAQIIVGGLVFPDDDWVRAFGAAGEPLDYDVIAIHAYPETWGPADVRVEDYLAGEQFANFLDALADLPHPPAPIWINELGAVSSGKMTPEQQAVWWVRAFGAFLAVPEVEHLGVYEIKDLARDEEAIGDEANYALGLIDAQRIKKPAFATLDLLTDLFGAGEITVADSQLKIETSDGGPAQAHLFRRPDGAQILIIAASERATRLDAALAVPGRAAYRYSLDGQATPIGDFDGRTLRQLAVAAGAVEIVRIDP